MLGFLAGLSFSMNKAAYAVGETPIYRITGARPGSQIAWTSYLNGQATGEYQAFYGQLVDSNGNATITAAQPWDASHIGQWQKHVIIIPPEWPNGSLENAQASFSVGEVATQTNPPPNTPTPTYPTQTPSGGGGILSGTVNLPIIGEVPTVGVIAGGAVLFLVLSSGGSSSGRR